MESMSDKLDTLIALIETQQQENKVYISMLKKADDRKKSDSVFIKVAATLVTGAAMFVVTNTMKLNNKIESKADKHMFAEKLSTAAYSLSENQRAEIFLNYVDYTSKNYLVRDEELRISERGRVEKSLSAMINAVTTRGE
jgi:hypothetical protein